MTRPEHTAVAACMRNEGLAILEWVAYHRVIGFDEIVICSNDCKDGSDDLLDALATAGALTHLRNLVPSDTAPQDSGMRLTFAYLEKTQAQWLAHIDADEFLNIGLGNGMVSDLLDKAGNGDVIALPWWAFGDSGHIHWPGAVLPHFTKAEKWPDPDRVKFKSMFRFRNFDHANDHMPTGPKTAHPTVLSARGDLLDAAALKGAKRAKYRPFDKSIRPKAACINHYAVPSRDVFLMKNDRGDGQGKITDKYHIGSRWHQIANRNETANTSIQRHLCAVETEMNRLRDYPGVQTAEQACQDWYCAHLASRLTPDRIAAWTKGSPL